MKKFIYLLVISFFYFGTIKAQDNSFGVIAGFQNVAAEVDGNGLSGYDGSAGFYVGVFKSFALVEKLSIQPEILYSHVFQDDESIGMIIVPALFKYFLSEGFSIQGGPMLDYTIDSDEHEKALGISFAVGAAYDFNEKLFLSARYAFGATNRLDETFYGNDFTGRLDLLQIGLGLRL